MRKIKINVEGMHCASCGNILEKVLSKKGVRDISVNVVMGKVFASVDDKMTEEDLKKAVKDAGYNPREIEFEEG